MSKLIFRSFLAIEIPLEIRNIIERITVQLRDSLAGIPLQWVAPKNIHLTLLFLGDISRDQINRLIPIIQTKLITISTITLSVTGLGAYPNSHHARVLWLGINSDPDLSVLINCLLDATSTCGISVNEKNYSPHLTLCRLRDLTTIDYAKVSSMISNSKIHTLGNFQVDSFKLFKSDLSASGPKYSSLFSFSLLK